MLGHLSSHLAARSDIGRVRREWRWMAPHAGANVPKKAVQAPHSQNLACHVAKVRITAATTPLSPLLAAPGALQRATGCARVTHMRRCALFRTASGYPTWARCNACMAPEVRQARSHCMWRVWRFIARYYTQRTSPNLRYWAAQQQAGSCWWQGADRTALSSRCSADAQAATGLSKAPCARDTVRSACHRRARGRACHAQLRGTVSRGPCPPATCASSALAFPEAGALRTVRAAAGGRR